MSFNDCKDQLLSALPEDKHARVLIIGCGNSTLGYDLMSQGGYTNLDNIDYSGVVIERMSGKHPEHAAST